MEILRPFVPANDSRRFVGSGNAGFGLGRGAGAWVSHAPTINEAQMTGVMSLRSRMDTFWVQGRIQYASEALTQVAQGSGIQFERRAGSGAKCVGKGRCTAGVARLIVAKVAATGLPSGDATRAAARVPTPASCRTAAAKPGMRVASAGYVWSASLTPDDALRERVAEEKKAHRCQAERLGWKVVVDATFIRTIGVRRGGFVGREFCQRIESFFDKYVRRQNAVITKLSEGVSVPASIIAEMGVGIAQNYAKHFGEPAGGFFSTARDVGAFCQMLLNGGVHHGKRLLSEKAVQTMSSIQTGRMPLSPQEAYGIGWSVKLRDDEGPSAGSYGHRGARRPCMWIDPKNGLAMVLLVERFDMPGDEQKVMYGDFMKAAVAKYGASTLSR
jgi:beta-lactamase family protein